MRKLFKYTNSSNLSMFKKIGKKLKGILVVSALVAALAAAIGVNKILLRKEKELEVSKTTITLTKQFQASTKKNYESMEKIREKIRVAGVIVDYGVKLFDKNKIIEAEEKLKVAKALHESILSDLNKVSFKDLYMKWQILKADVESDPERANNLAKQLTRLEELTKFYINQKQKLITSCIKQISNIDGFLKIIKEKKKDNLPR